MILLVKQSERSAMSGVLGVVSTVLSGLSWLRAKEIERSRQALRIVRASNNDCPHIFLVGTDGVLGLLYNDPDETAFLSAHKDVSAKDGVQFQTEDAGPVFWHPDRYFLPRGDVYWLDREWSTPLDKRRSAGIIKGDKSGGYQNSPRGGNGEGYCRFCEANRNV